MARSLPHDDVRRGGLRRVFDPAAAELPPIRTWGPWWAGALVALAFVAIVFVYDQAIDHTPLAGLLLEGGLLAALLALVAWRRRDLAPHVSPLRTWGARGHWILNGAIAVLATATVVGLMLHLVLPDDMHGIGHKLPADTGGRVLAGITMVVLAPLVEETVFRGWLMRSLTTRMRPLLAVLVSGTIFGALHIWLARYSLEMGLELFFVGYALAFVCLWSGSMIPNVAGHMTLNCTAFFSVVSPPVDTAVMVVVALAIAGSLLRARRTRHTTSPVTA
jgi:membrane protease YdiL (CAAX protease family)